jgi:hypothetical protein
MKTSILTIFLLLFVHIAFCQDSLAVSDTEKTKAIVTRLSRELALSNSQQTKVESIIKKRFASILKLRNRGLPIDRQAANKTAVDELQKILSNDQFDLLLRLRLESKRAKDAFMAANPSYKFSEDDNDLDI